HGADHSAPRADHLTVQVQLVQMPASVVQLIDLSPIRQGQCILAKALSSLLTSSTFPPLSTNECQAGIAFLNRSKHSLVTSDFLITRSSLSPPYRQMGLIL
ncbi:hypothetical protein N7617_25180, partial [Pseudomonas juntendi]|uniref:hypothetical protein n=1 Tax=Pseudomonas juntendi TaxID=2666183 RepID=UPI00244CEB1E